MANEYWSELGDLRSTAERIADERAQQAHKDGYSAGFEAGQEVMRKAAVHLLTEHKITFDIASLVTEHELQFGVRAPRIIMIVADVEEVARGAWILAVNGLAVAPAYPKQEG